MNIPIRTRLKALWLRVTAVARQRQLDRDLDDELAFHLAMREQAHRTAGLDADAARDTARRQFGSPARVKESLGDLWQWRSLDRAWQDLRFAARAARRQPAFTLVVILTLALGIGATTAMFGIVDAVMLRPFPFPQPERLVMVWETNRDRGIDTFVGSPANYADWQQATATTRTSADTTVEASGRASASGATAGRAASAGVTADANTSAAPPSAFAELGAWELRNDNRTDGPRPEQVQGAVASSAFFRALQVRPALGRFFRVDEDLPANRHVAVLGHEYWRRAFGGDAAVIGRAILVNGESHTVVGVAPAMRPPFRADIWRPLAPNVAALDRGDHSLLVVGRLAAGQSRARAEAELQTVAARLAATYPETNRGWNVRLESMFDALVVRDTRRAMLILMGAVALLLLIACVNVANLLLARATGRQREIATRLALGASRGRLVRQLLTESALLAAAGGAAGLLVAAWGLRLVQWLYPADIAGLDEARLDPYALAFALATSLLTTLLVGLAPALQVSRGGSASGAGRGWRYLSLGRAVRGPAVLWSGAGGAGGGLMLGTRGATDAPRTRRMRHALVVAEIALALALLIGAGLLMRSVERLRHVPLGFNADRVLTAKIGLYGDKYGRLANYVSFIDRLLRDLQTRPGVGAAGVASSVPFGNGYTVRQTWRESDAKNPSAEGVLTNWRVVGGDYFKAMGIPLLQGRAFREADGPQPANSRVPRVTIVSDALARRLWPGENPIGKMVLAGDSRRPYEVVGVVGHTRLTALGSDPGPAMYYHYRQFSWASLTIVVRAIDDRVSPGDRRTGAPDAAQTGGLRGGLEGAQEETQKETQEGTPRRALRALLQGLHLEPQREGREAALEGVVRSAVAAIDRDQPVFDVQPMHDRIDRAAAIPQMHAALLALFAGLALALSAIGVYGVMSYAAAQRTSEIGLRLALGAQRLDVLVLVWRRGLALTAVGLTLGLGIALLAGRALASLLYEVSATDATTYATGLGVMAAVALTACYLPAHRAMGTDPVVALRHE